MFIYHLNSHYMKTSPEMSGCINLQTMNCLIGKYLNLTGHVVIKVLSMKQVHYLQMFLLNLPTKIVSEYDQEIPQSQTADNPLATRGRAAQPSRDNRKTN